MKKIYYILLLVTLLMLTNRSYSQTYLKDSSSFKCSFDTCTHWIVIDSRIIHLGLKGWKFEEIWYPYTIHPQLTELNNAHLFKAYSNEWCLEIFMSSQMFLADIYSFKKTIIRKQPVVLY
jgi:hypothetical protein